MTDRVGQQLGNYRLLRLLGRGGFADVYLGEHVYLKKPAALKVLYMRLDEQDTTQFLREAQTLAGLDHPHIVRVLDFAVQDGMPFLVMDYATGGTLRTRHPAGTRVPLEQINAYVSQVASALQYAHHQRLTHRDVKPENMLLGAQEQVLLGDFGLATLTPSSRSGSTQAMDPAMAGTALYFAPEQVQGKPRPASDQYALGVVVYEWLSGQRPFRGTPIEVALQHISAPPPSLHEQLPDLSPAVAEVVMRALAKEPELRFPSVQDFALALAEVSKKEASGQTLPVLASGYSAEAGRGAASMHHLPRGTVTLLFTDMEGSSSLLQQVGQRYTQVLGECRRLLRAAFHQYHGHEVDTQGDAFFVAFARATDALSAAVAAQRALASHAWPTGVTVRVRMGLHTGEPELTSEGYVGLDVHHAARIMSAGHGGQVLLSQTTRELVENDLPEGVSLRDLGEHRLKDLGHSRRLFQLVVTGLPADFPPLKTLAAHPNNLPVQLTPLIGREHEVVTVQQLLQRQDIHLLTLTGPGGTGKTRLGLQVAEELSERFADGVFFVNLAPLSDPALVMTTIAQTLSIGEVGGQPMLQTVQERLRQRQMLLLLDNFEQVVSAAGEVAELLTACPQLAALVTSRASLHVRGEHEFAVPPLELPDLKHLPDPVALSRYAAVALFLQRAQAVKPEFQLTNTNARAVAEICVRLDGLPLAIELAAARIKLLPPQALLERLGRRLALLTSGARDVPARQQTLRSTIQWSYDLLDAQEQHLFRLLSVFVGGCTLEAIEGIGTALSGAADAGWVLDGIGSLIDKSLLQQREMEVGKKQEPRLLLLETIREFGLEALAASGRLEAAQQAHALYYLTFAEQAEPHLKGSEQGRWSARMEQEQDNLRAALTWLLEAARKGQGSEEGRQQAERALRLCVALMHWFWDMRGRWREGWTFFEQSLTVGEGVAASLRARALCMAANMIWSMGDLDRAQALAEAGLALFRELGDIAGIADALETLAAIPWYRSQYAVARSQLEEAKALFQEVGDTWSRGRCLTTLARIATAQGEYVRARTHLEESREIYKGLGDQHRVGYVLYLLARVLFLSGSDLAEAQALAEQSLGLLRAVGDRSFTYYVLNLLGQMHLQQREQNLAREKFAASLATLKERAEDQWATAEALIGLARVAAVQGEEEEARALYQESLALVREIDNKEFIPACLEGLAGVAAAQGELAWAARLWGAAEALREAIGTPLPPVECADYEAAIIVARTSLGENAFTIAWTQGRTMTPEQALAAQGAATIPSPTLAEAPSTAPTKTSPTYPAGLTAREMEVLRLVAQGMTNPQIAEQLILSLHTVNAHVRSIYNKLEVNSRSALTRYALEHHLL